MTQQELLARLDAAMKVITPSDMGQGLLPPEKAARFIRTVTQATPVLDQARRIIMHAPQRDIDRIRFGSRILMTPAQAAADPDGVKPTVSTNSLNAVKVKTYAGISDDTLEENIERENFEDTLLEMIGDRVGIDLEELFLQGDEDSLDPFLALLDGWLKESAAQLDGATDFDATDVEDMFDTMLTTVPQEYLRNRSEWTIWTTFEQEDAYRNVLRSRGTGLGDMAQTSDNALAYKGIKVRELGNMPGGESLLAPDGNLVWGVLRDIRVERERRAGAEETVFWVTARVDCTYEDENASVHAFGYTGP